MHEDRCRFGETVLSKEAGPFGCKRLVQALERILFRAEPYVRGFPLGAGCDVHALLLEEHEGQQRHPQREVQKIPMQTGHLFIQFQILTSHSERFVLEISRLKDSAKHKHAISLLCDDLISFQ